MTPIRCSGRDPSDKCPSPESCYARKRYNAHRTAPRGAQAQSATAAPPSRRCSPLPARGPPEPELCPTWCLHGTTPVRCRGPRLKEHVASKRLRRRRAGGAADDLHADAGATLGLKNVTGQVLGREAAVVAPAQRVLQAQRACRVQAAQIPARQPTELTPPHFKPAIGALCSTDAPVHLQSVHAASRQPNVLKQ